LNRVERVLPQFEILYYANLGLGVFGLFHEVEGLK